MNDPIPFLHFPPKLFLFINILSLQNTILSFLLFKHDGANEIVFKMTYYRPKIPSSRSFCSNMTARMK